MQFGSDAAPAYGLVILLVADHLATAAANEVSSTVPMLNDAEPLLIFAMEPFRCAIGDFTARLSSTASGRSGVARLFRVNRRRMASVFGLHRNRSAVVYLTIQSYR